MGSELSSQGEFVNYFRGLYFDVSTQNDGLPLAYLNLSAANISLYITSNIEGIEDTPVRIQSTFNISAGRSPLNLINNNRPSSLIDEITNGNTESGVERIYLQGGVGSMAILELFGMDADSDGTADALEDFRATGENWIINEANLVFHVDQDALDGADPEAEPERIFIYDIDNGQILLDAFIDGGSSSPLNTITNHLGRLIRDENENGVSYRIRMTEHVTNILRDEDAENPRLAVTVSQNVEVLTTREVKQSPDVDIDNLATGSIISHEGTVLHGNLSDDLEKRLKFTIYYTEINN